MGESSQSIVRPSNFRGLIFEPKKNRVGEQRIPFRDLAKLAAPRKTVAFLVEQADCDPSTAKRWLSGQSPASGKAVRIVFANIMARLE